MATSLRIFLTIPVPVGSTERSFNKLKIIKKYIRNLRITMIDDYECSHHLSIEHKTACTLSFDDIFKTFAAKKVLVYLRLSNCTVIENILFNNE